jgi:hypothetical protein
MIKKLAKEILGLSRSELKTQGEASRKLYVENFETESCIRNYARQILEAIKK